MNNDKKQKLLLEYLVSSPDTFALCQGIINPDYFVPELRYGVEFVKEYYNEYHTTPSLDQIEAESGVMLKPKEVTPDQVQYCALEVESFCKRQAFLSALVEGVKFAKEDQYGDAFALVQSALEVSLNANLGVHYFEDVEERLARMMQSNTTMSTGWSEVDDALFGGISRKELLLVSANSGGGKSITLANLATHFVEEGRTVLYISLELSEDVVAQRFDTMFTGIGRKEWKHNVNEITTRLQIEKEKSGTLDIKYMSGGTTANEIRSYLKEYYLKFKRYPDLLCLDYIDEMGANEKVSADNVFEKDKRTSTQLRQLGVDFDMATATASQLNRSAVGNPDLNHAHIAGGISKINVCDVYFSIVMTDVMKAQGEAMFKMQKTRNSDGVGTVIHLAWDAKYLRIRDGNGSRPKGLEFVAKEKVNTPNTSLNEVVTNSLYDLMDD